jgi:hypothetical protein
MRRWRIFVALALASATFVACGDADEPAAVDDPPTTPATEEAPTVTDDEFPSYTIVAEDHGYDIPDDLTGGVIELTLQNDGEDMHEAMFVSLPEDVEIDQLIEDMRELEEGAPIPDYFDTLTGVFDVPPGESRTHILQLPAGRYAVIDMLPVGLVSWDDRPADPEGPADDPDGTDGTDDATTTDTDETTDTTDAAATDTTDTTDTAATDTTDTTDTTDATATDNDDDDVTDDEGDAPGGDPGTAPGAEAQQTHADLGMYEIVEVTEENDLELPELDGVVTIGDYSFDLPEITPGSHELVAVNGGGEFHHVIFMEWPEEVDSEDRVQEIVDAFFEAGEGPPPDDLPEPGEAGGSSIFSPGLGGSFEAEFQSGRWYTAICFIHDRAGGPPHAIAHQMYEHFQVD